MKERKKERGPKKLSSFFFFEVYLGYQIPQKKKNLLLGGGDKDYYTKKREIFLFAWPACVDASKNKAKKTNENTQKKKKKQQHLHKFGGGQRDTTRA